MTPVQLPEVPAPVAYWWGAALLYPGQIDQSQRDEADALITHEQARRYATQAVMAERARLDWLVEQLRGADLYAALYPHYVIGGDIRAAIDAHTQPEQNSGR